MVESLTIPYELTVNIYIILANSEEEAKRYVEKNIIIKKVNSI